MLDVRDPADDVAADYTRVRAGFEMWRRTGVLDRATLAEARVEVAQTVAVKYQW